MGRLAVGIVPKSFKGIVKSIDDALPRHDLMKLLVEWENNQTRPLTAKKALAEYILHVVHDLYDEKSSDAENYERIASGFEYGVEDFERIVRCLLKLRKDAS